MNHTNAGDGAQCPGDFEIARLDCPVRFLDAERDSGEWRPRTRPMRHGLSSTSGPKLHSLSFCLSVQIRGDRRVTVLGCFPCRAPGASSRALAPYRLSARARDKPLRDTCTLGSNPAGGAWLRLTEPTLRRGGQIAGKSFRAGHARQQNEDYKSSDFSQKPRGHHWFQSINVIHLPHHTPVYCQVIA